MTGRGSDWSKSMAHACMAEEEGVKERNKMVETKQNSAANKAQAQAQASKRRMEL